MNAIETIYKGYRFRSRLEARWAILFDKMKVKYEYEPEGFRLNDGKYYLPDFYLRDLDTYVEIKHSDAIQLTLVEDGIEFDSKNEDATKYVSAIETITDKHKFAIVQGDPFDIAAKGHNENGRADLFIKGVCAGLLHSFDDENFTCTGGQKCSECDHYMIPAHYPITGFTRDNIIILLDSFPDVFPLDEHVIVALSKGDEGFDILRKDINKEKLVDDACKFIRAALEARQARFEHGERGA